MAVEGTGSVGKPADVAHVLLAQENERLRKRLSGALQHLEESREQVHNLQLALNFWLPIIPPDAPIDEHPCISRIERDARLLFKFEGPSDDQCAVELGWVTLHLHPTDNDRT